MCLEKDPHIYFRSWENEIEIRSCVLFLIFVFLAMQHGMRILVSQRRIKPMPPALEVQCLNHWTVREVPRSYLFWRFLTSFCLELVIAAPSSLSPSPGQGLVLVHHYIVQSHSRVNTERKCVINDLLQENFSWEYVCMSVRIYWHD